MIDIRKREAIREATRGAVAKFGGADILVNTAAIFPSSPDGVITDSQWALTLDVNVTANYLLADEATKLFRGAGAECSMVLTSSANAVVAKRGSEAYDVSKAALSHLVRELAVVLSPLVRVNGISPATVVKGSTMFPRDRVMASLRNIEFRSISRRAMMSFATCWPVFMPSGTYASAHRPERLRRGDLVSRRTGGALHHRAPDSGGRRIDRGVSKVTRCFWRLKCSRFAVSALRRDTARAK